MSQDTEMLRVVLVDDQRLVRSGFALMLSTERDIEVVGEAANGAEAIEVTDRLRPDIVLMDVQMPVLDGIRATEAIVSAGHSRVVILTTFDRDDYLFDALQAGASGFLLKNADPDHLMEAIRAAARGHALLAPEVTLRVIRRMTDGMADDVADDVAEGVTDGVARRSAAGAAGGASSAGRGTSSMGVSVSAGGARPGTGARHPGLDRLTEREREVLVLMGRGLSNSEIAADLILGEATVKTHVSNVLAKLVVRDRVQAVVVAHQNGLIPAME